MHISVAMITWSLVERIGSGVDSGLSAVINLSLLSDYLSGLTALTGQNRIILLGDRDTHVLITCPRLLCGTLGPEIESKTS